MNKKLVISIMFMMLVTMFGVGQGVVAQNSSVIAKAQSITGDRFTIVTRTPKGATIYAVNRPTATVLNAIDKGLADLFAVSRKNGYRTRLNYSDYTIYIAKADRTKNAAGEYSPDFAVGAQQYAGSVYDQGGYIYAAGMVLAACVPQTPPTATAAPKPTDPPKPTAAPATPIAAFAPAVGQVVAESVPDSGAELVEVQKAHRFPTSLPFSRHVAAAFEADQLSAVPFICSIERRRAMRFSISSAIAVAASSGL